jgi:hypothetical protein
MMMKPEPVVAPVFALPLPPVELQRERRCGDPVRAPARGRPLSGQEQYHKAIKNCSVGVLNSYSLRPNERTTQVWHVGKAR